MKVHYNYLINEFATNEEIFDEWRELIITTDFTLGRYVEEFEHIFANFVGANHCISTNNGTDALILSLKALGIGAGDEVITVANTFYATVGAIVAVGATPVLVDADDRFQISPSSIEAAITEKTVGILPVHWAGASPDMAQIMKLAADKNLLVVEDACMGIGAKVNGQVPGTFGDIGAFSMHPLKSLNVMGDGGMVVTDCDNLAGWMRKYRNHGMTDRDHIEFWGVNMRLQPLQAIVAKHRLRELDKTIKKRNENAMLLDSELSKLNPMIILPKRNKNNQETFALYMVLAERRDELLAFLHEQDIEAKIHYPVPLNQQAAANNNCRLATNLDNVDYQAKRLITLPVHQYLDTTHMEYMVNKITEFYS